MISNVAKILPLLLYVVVAVPKKKKFNPEFEREEFKERCLDWHNLLRALHGAPPLVWDDELAESSQARASQLNTLQTMKYNSGRYGDNLYESHNPENIDLMCEYACKSWFMEFKRYKFRKNPGWSNTTSHFTQMVWKSSERVGIGEAGQAGGNFYIVARYYPPGNIDGQFRKNVKRRKRLRKSCIPKFMDPNKVTALARKLGIKRMANGKWFIDQDDAPCDVEHLPEEEPGEDDKDAEQEKGQQTGETTGEKAKTNETTDKKKTRNKNKKGKAGTTGNNGNKRKKGTKARAGTRGVIEGLWNTEPAGAVIKTDDETQPILVGIPIAEPRGAQQSASIIVQKDGNVVQPAGNVVVTGSRATPQFTLQQPAGVNSPPPSTTPTSYADRNVLLVLNPVRATNGKFGTNNVSKSVNLTQAEPIEGLAIKFQVYHIPGNVIGKPACTVQMCLDLRAASNLYILIIYQQSPEGRPEEREYSNTLVPPEKNDILVATRSTKSTRRFVGE